MLAGPSGPSESQRQAAVKAVAPSYTPRQNQAFGPGAFTGNQGGTVERYSGETGRAGGYGRGGEGRRPLSQRDYQGRIYTGRRGPRGGPMVSTKGRTERPVYVPKTSGRTGGTLAPEARGGVQYTSPARPGVKATQEKQSYV